MIRQSTQAAPWVEAVTSCSSMQVRLSACFVAMLHVTYPGLTGLTEAADTLLAAYIWSLCFALMEVHIGPSALRFCNVQLCVTLGCMHHVCLFGCCCSGEDGVPLQLATSCSPTACEGVL
jgi:hypothetical protein